MKIAVFGATGLVGKYIVKQALLKGYEVNAFGRNVFEEFDEQENLHLLKGSAFEAAQVRNAVAGAYAVLSAIGGGPEADDRSRSLGMKTILQEMSAAGISRLICVGDAGILDDGKGALVMDSEEYPAKNRNVADEYQRVLQLLQGSSTEWTIACPARVENAEATGNYHVKADELPALDKGFVNAGDLSLFMLSEIVNRDFICKKVGISD